MSTSTTQTTTYTSVDIRKVVDNFAADFSMMAGSTGLRTRDSVAEVVSDLKVFAEAGLLEKVALILKDKDSVQIRGAVYTVAASSLGWRSERPGNAIWPKTLGGSLFVLATLSNEWWVMTESQRAAFMSSRGLKGSWPATSEDTSFAGLKASAGQKYSSNGYGWERTNYS